MPEKIKLSREDKKAAQALEKAHAGIDYLASRWVSSEYARDVTGNGPADSMISQYKAQIRSIAEANGLDVAVEMRKAAEKFGYNFPGMEQGGEFSAEVVEEKLAQKKEEERKARAKEKRTAIEKLEIQYLNLATKTKNSHEQLYDIKQEAERLAESEDFTPEERERVLKPFAAHVELIRDPLAPPAKLESVMQEKPEISVSKKEALSDREVGSKPEVKDSSKRTFWQKLGFGESEAKRATREVRETKEHLANAKAQIEHLGETHAKLLAKIEQTAGLSSEAVQGMKMSLRALENQARALGANANLREDQIVQLFENPSPNVERAPEPKASFWENTKDRLRKGFTKFAFATLGISGMSGTPTGKPAAVEKNTSKHEISVSAPVRASNERTTQAKADENIFAETYAKKATGKERVKGPALKDVDTGKVEMLAMPEKDSFTIDSYKEVTPEETPIKIDTIGKEFFRNYSENQRRWDWGPSVNGYEMAPLGNPTHEQENQKEFFVADPEVKNIDGYRIPRNLWERIDIKVWDKLKSHPEALRIFMSNLENNESIGAYTIDLLETGEELAIQDGALLNHVQDIKFIHGADDSLSAEQIKETHATRVTPRGMFAVTLVTPEYEKKHHINLKAEGHYNDGLLFHIAGNAYKHGFLKTDVTSQIEAVKSSNANEKCKSQKCERQSHASLEALYNYVLPKENNANGERYFYSYIMGKGDVVNPKTGALEKKTPEQLRLEIQEGADAYRKTHPVRFKKILIEAYEKGGDKVSFERDISPYAIRSINRINDVVTQAPANAPLFPIGG